MSLFVSVARSSYFQTLDNALKVVGLVAWNTAPGFVGGHIVVDRADLYVIFRHIAARHIQGHHHNLEDLELVSRYHRSIDLVNPSSVVEPNRP
jgi:hypothetical protein